VTAVQALGKRYKATKDRNERQQRTETKGSRGQKQKAAEGRERQQSKGRKSILKAADGLCRHQQGWHDTYLKGLHTYLADEVLGEEE